MDASLYTFPSPLEPYRNAPPLPSDTNQATRKAKSYLNEPTRVLSKAYESFPEPIESGFDIHIYFLQKNPIQTKFAEELHERIRREFPELRIYRIWYEPIGPHPTGMFEVNVDTPSQFGAFISWLVINRGPLSCLLHPNTSESVERDHSQRATWLGERLPLDLEGMARVIKERDEALRALKQSSLKG